MLVVVLFISLTATEIPIEDRSKLPPPLPSEEDIVIPTVPAKALIFALS